MLVEIDEIVVRKELLDRVRNGDKDALIQAQREFEGMHLYFHILSTDPSEALEVITLREADKLRIIESVRTDGEPGAWHRHRYPEAK